MGAEASGKSARTITKQVRVSPEECRELEAIARGRGVSLSALLRDAALGKRVSRGRLRGAAEGGSESVLPESSSSSGPLSAASSPAASGAGAGAVSSSAVPAFRCPVMFPGTRAVRCDFSALSPRAVCPVHGRKVVAA